jgi:hypothetical protein
MVKRTLEELKPYDAPGHYRMAAMRIHGKEETGAEKFWVGLSTLLRAAARNTVMRQPSGKVLLCP